MAELKEATITTTITQPGSALVRSDYQRLALKHIDGLATDDDLAVLESHTQEWISALRYLLKKADQALEHVRSTVHGPERPLVLEDFESHRSQVAAALAELADEPPPPPPGASADRQAEAADDDQDDTDDEPVGDTALQLSWDEDQLVVWAAGNGAATAEADELRARLEVLGAASIPWEPHAGVPLPDGTHAPALAAPIKSTLGWLVSLRPDATRPDATRPDATAPAGTDDRDLGAVGTSAAWMALASALAVRLVAQGRMVPQVRRTSGKQKGQSGRSDYQVHWIPALIDHDEFTDLSRVMPGAVMALSRSNDRRAFTEHVVAGVVDAICTDAAARVEVPAPPPRPRSATEVAETILALMNGRIFDAPTQRGNELAKGLQTWAKHITGTATITLTLQLDPPDEGDAWYLRTSVPGGNRKLEPVDAAMSNASQNRREQIKAELDRLEGIYEPLLRGKAERRGEVILSQEEAWELMTEVGPVLAAAGFDVQVPPLSRKKPRPGLKLTSTDSQESVVGAQQLTYVRWSAVFGDVELTAKEIMDLSSEARPLVKAHGRWVELDKADLQAAADALAQRAEKTQMSGAEMLRHAMGLEGSPLHGGIAVEGEAWAVDLLRSARGIPEHPPVSPPGFNGELRSYQADALAWLRFLDEAGLGGILALDMGLGKTPTLLAHLATSRGEDAPTADAGRPSLVIAPPAVLGNWAHEARKFTPGLKVRIHHGQNRPGPRELIRQVEDVDVILTTYGTGMRDVDALEQISWGKIVLDEGQAIKNPTSETAQQLRRLEAHSRIILTGTPIENGLGDLWALLDFTNPGLVGDRASFVAQLSRTAEGRSTAEEALRTLNGVLVYRRTKAEPAIAEELPDRIDTLDHCAMTPEQIGLYQAVLDGLMQETADDDSPKKKGAVLAAITALKQICNHPAAYLDDDDRPLEGRSGKLTRLNEIVDNVFEAGERVLIFTHFASWGEKLARYLTDRTGVRIDCYHGGLARGARDRIIEEFQRGTGKGALVLSLKAGGTGLNLTAASHVVLYDRWWNPAVEDQARDRAWRIGQTRTVVAHRLVCPGTVDERVEEVVEGKRQIADMALPKSSSVGDLDSDQLQRALGIDPELLLTDDDDSDVTDAEEMVDA
ncbi:DEAD/DEAH box helicase [Euzebya sp.]|uniref:DEAD/DEAH box helicase n=1 Tax=Euzebya sp. TaxID=1971409 RepID=UPI0035127CC7